MIKSITKSMKKYPFWWFIFGLVLGLILGSLITYFFGLEIGPMKIYYNGTGICIGSC